MQFSSAVPILLLWLQAATAAPVPLVPRQASVVQGALSRVMSALQSLDGAIKSVGPDVTSALPLLDQVQQAQRSFREAGDQIQSSKKLRLAESAGLLQPAQDVVNMAKTTLGDLVQKKPIFDQLGVSNTVADTLRNQKTASVDLSDALVAKLPKVAKGVAGGPTSDLAQAVDDAIRAYEAPPARAPGAAPGITVPAPSITLPAPSITLPAPSVTLPAPALTPPAPVAPPQAPPASPALAAPALKARAAPVVAPAAPLLQ